MSESYQLLDMVAQLGNDPSIEEQQQLALAPAHANLALAQQQQQQLLASQQQQLAAEQQSRAEQSGAAAEQPVGAAVIPLAMSLPPGIAARSQSRQSFTSAVSGMDDLSEDSLIVSPDKSKRARAGNRSTSGPRVDPRSASGSKERTRKTSASVTRPLASRSRSGKPQERPPRMHPPMPSTAPVTRPRVVEPTDGTPEARLAALEEQRMHDHQVIHDLATAVMALQNQAVQQASGLQALTQSGLTLRQEVFAARSDVAAVTSSANEAAQSAAMAQMAITVEAKFEQLDRLTADLTTGVHALGLREQRVEQVVEQQVAALGPQEGIITDAFLQLNAKISHVASLAQAVDGTQVTAKQHNVVPFTMGMMTDVKRISDELASMPAHITAEILRLIQPVNVEISDLRVKGLTQDESIGALEANADRLEAAIIAAGSTSTAPTCSVCSPTPQPTSVWVIPTVVPDSPG